MGRDTSYERYEVDWAAYHQRARTGPCFICQIIAGDPEFPADLVYEDEIAIAFLDKYPRVLGYTLVAPKAHREDLFSSFTPSEYLDLQAVVRRVGLAVQEVMDAERMYILSLGSNQGNAHVHFHIVPLPRGVPYEEQQLAIYRQGVLRFPEADRVALAQQIAARVR
jgi:diadenosine tetraphosphate (Ap4A) HIT family hydrolase